MRKNKAQEKLHSWIRKARTDFIILNAYSKSSQTNENTLKQYHSSSTQFGGSGQGWEWDGELILEISSYKKKQHLQSAQE